MNPAQFTVQQSLEAAWGYYQYGLTNEAVTTILDSLEQHPESKELAEALTEFTNASSPAPLPQQLDQPPVAVPKLVPAVVSAPPPPKKEEPAIAAAPVPPKESSPVETRKSLEARIANIFKLPAEQLKPVVAEKKDEPSPLAAKNGLDKVEDESHDVAPSAPSDDEKADEKKPVASLPNILKANGQKRKRHPDEAVMAGLMGEMPQRRACVKRMYEQKAQKAAAKAINGLDQKAAPAAARKKDQEEK